ncbi:hypothetical protein GWK47_026952 [Chionoecetes opilio]|uniref:Uncharacterized protein n=1 Tax=Chionoecetes opilio TaxID=41210 RepID=A0A8J8WE49_CHIOP|nr:hypothetical protein GWK47_026952 [Chionoecetes opilio]
MALSASRPVPRKFYFHHGIEKTKPVAAKEVIEAVLLIWGRAGIPNLRSPNRQGEAPQPGGQVRGPSKHRKRASETPRIEEKNVKGGTWRTSSTWRAVMPSIDDRGGGQCLFFAASRRTDDLVHGGIRLRHSWGPREEKGEGAGRRDEE